MTSKSDNPFSTCDEPDTTPRAAGTFARITNPHHYFGHAAPVASSVRHRARPVSPPTADQPLLQLSGGGGARNPDSALSWRLFGACCVQPNSPRDDYQYEFVPSHQPLAKVIELGTHSKHSVWINRGDKAGLIMSAAVWVISIYGTLTIVFLGKTEGIATGLSTFYIFLSCLALACHAKTTLTDPGAVPKGAVGLEPLARAPPTCSRCKTFKPLLSHHCRICNRCVSRMDHHCPWMNNCVGAGNLKHFILFLLYTWTCTAYSLTLLGFNYFLCATEDCTFNIILVQLARVMTLLNIAFFLFTSSMIMNIVYGIMTGIGTIDRMKKKSAGTMANSDEEPLLLKNVFGVGPMWQWLLPIDPIFEDTGIVLGWKWANNKG